MYPVSTYLAPLSNSQKKKGKQEKKKEKKKSQLCSANRVNHMAFDPERHLKKSNRTASLHTHTRVDKVNTLSFLPFFLS